MVRLHRLTVVMLLATLVGARAHSQEPGNAAPRLGGPEIIQADSDDEARIRPRVTVREDTGDGVGYQRGYVYGEAFVPIWQTPGRRIVFLDARGVNFLHAQRWEWNAGFGARFQTQCDWVLGVNSFFDWRDTGVSTFRQIGVGFEALGPIVDVRSNLYFPIGTQRRFVGDGGFSNPQFSGYNILLDHARIYENAMRGFDLEVGAPVPCCERWGLRAYAGYYHYESPGVRNADGVRGRLEAMATDYFSAHFQIQNDRVFDTTVSGGIALHWGGRRPLGAERTTTDRLRQRIVRDPNIVVARSTESTQEAALDPNTGQPIVVRHVSSGAASGGDGTYERPYRTLEQIELGSRPGDILFAHVNSVFTDQFIILQNRQRLLGEGILHQFTSRQGTFHLPNHPGNAPLIRLTCACALDSITLANGNEVSGFAVDQPAGAAVFGQDIIDFNINRNRFTNPGFGNGSVMLINAGGTGVIADNTLGQTLANPGTFGFVIVDGQNPLRLTMTNNTTFGHDIASGVIDIADPSSKVYITMRNNRFNDTSAGLLAGVSAGYLALQLNYNTSTVGYDLAHFGGTFLLAADGLTSNSGPFTITGGVQIVPAGLIDFR